MTNNDFISSGALKKFPAFPGTPVTVITAPAGCGKTALLKNAAQSCESVYINLTKSDSDGASLTEHILSLCTAKYPVEVKNDIISAICKTLAKADAILMLDGWEKCDCDETRTVLSHISSLTNSRFRLVVASRLLPGPLARYLLENPTARLGFKELAMHHDDVFALTSRVCGLDAGEAEILTQSIMKTTCGWRGAVLPLVKAAASGLSLDRICAASGLRSYIEYEILAELAPDISDFVRRAALLGRLDGELCECCVESGCENKICRLIEEDFFVTGNPAEFIGIFAECASSSLLTEEKNKIISSAVDLYLSRHDFSGATGLLLRHKKTQMLGELISRCGDELLALGMFDLLSRCLHILDTPGYTPAPEVYGVFAQYFHHIGDSDKCERCLNIADSMFGKENFYSACRSLYRAIKHRIDSEVDETVSMRIRNAVFFIKENGFKLPLLSAAEKEHIDVVTSSQSRDDEKPISANEFGAFSITVLCDGRELPWRTKKGCELFAYLISQNGEPADRTKLFNILWDEEIPTNAVAMLHNMIYNVRRELSAYGLENLIVYRNKKYRIDTALINRSSDGIERICKAAEAKNIDDIVENRKLLKDYWGIYLENIDSRWANEKKEYYDKIFVIAETMLGDYFGGQKAFDRAISHYTAAMKIDPYSEELAQKIIGSLSFCGRHDRIRTFYCEFSALLKKDLGITPGAALDTFCKSCAEKENGRKI